MRRPECEYPCGDTSHGSRRWLAMPSIRDTLCNTTPGTLVARQRSGGQSVGDAVYPGYAVGTWPRVGGEGGERMSKARGGDTPFHGPFVHRLPTRPPEPVYERHVVPSALSCNCVEMNKASKANTVPEQERGKRNPVASYTAERGP